MRLSGGWATAQASGVWGSIPRSAALEGIWLSLPTSLNSLGSWAPPGDLEGTQTAGLTWQEAVLGLWAMVTGIP